MALFFVHFFPSFQSWNRKVMMKYIGSKLAIESVNKDKSHGSFCHGTAAQRNCAGFKISSDFSTLTIYRIWRPILDWFSDGSIISVPTHTQKEKRSSISWKIGKTILQNLRIKHRYTRRYLSEFQVKCHRLPFMRSPTIIAQNGEYYQ